MESTQHPTQKDSQRIERGFSEEDTFSFDYYLANVIAGGVARLRERGLGHPAEITFEEWMAVLAKIEKGFAAYVADDSDNVGNDEWSEAWDLFRRWFPALWD